MIDNLAGKATSLGTSLLGLYPSRVRPLAEPPEGSGLKPVMGDFGPPGIGYTVNALTEPLEFARRRLNAFGPVQWGGIFGRRVVGTSGPEATEAVLLDRDKAFSAAKGYGYFIGPFFHGGLLLRDFEDHFHHRRIMQQAFTRPRLVGYLDLTNPAIERGIEAWEPASQFPLYTATKRLLLNLATEVFVGAALGQEGRALERAFEDSVRGGQAVIRANVPGGTWARGLRGRRILSDYFLSALPTKRVGNGDDLFSVLCRIASEEGDTFTDKDVIDHMIFVMMAAHDTSTIALSMMAYHLGKNPDLQDQVRAESRALGKASLDYEDFERLPTLDLVFKEALRMNAPVGLLFRETVKDTEILGHYIPAGTIVAVAPYVSMRTAQWWPNPDDFDPERFADDRREDNVHRFAWAPFGAGAHKCIGLNLGGMQVKAIMHQMVLRFTWTVPADYEVPLRWGTGPTPSDGLPIDLKLLAASPQIGG